MNIIDRPSPNFDDREGQEIDMLVLHYTGMKTAEGAIDKLCNPEAKVSAHYVVDEDGSILRLVPEDKRAWHAGKSFWRGNTNINQRSIGIEIVNPGHEYGYRAFPEAQIQSVIALCRNILSRHHIPARNVVGHSDIAPQRKEDPGELFDWQRLANQGIGLWGLGIRQEKLTQIPNPESQIPLQTYGYDTADLSKTITAFQRHFRPKLLNGQWDNECAALLASLLDSGH